MNDDCPCILICILQGDTPLHMAAQQAGAEVVKLLLAHACCPVLENLMVSCSMYNCIWRM